MTSSLLKNTHKDPAPSGAAAGGAPASEPCVSSLSNHCGGRTAQACAPAGLSRRKQNRPLTPRLVRIKKLHEEGLDHHEIAPLIGSTPKSVYNAIRRMKYGRDCKGPPRFTKADHIRWLLKEGYSVEQAAAFAKVSKSYVHDVIAGSRGKTGLTAHWVQRGQRAAA